jgi:hypothetical protein
MWTMVWWYRMGLTPNSFTRALWQPTVLSGGPVSRDISGASTRMGEENENLVYPSLWDFERSLTCRKILRHGTSGFTSYLKEGVLWIIIALKNPLPCQDSNPRPLGPVTSTLTTTPPRRLRIHFFSWRRCGSSTQVWMPTYVSILRIPQVIWVWRATVEWYWQEKTEELGEKPVPVPLFPPHIPHGLTRARTRASAVRGRRLTTWDKARPPDTLTGQNNNFGSTELQFVNP